MSDSVTKWHESSEEKSSKRTIYPGGIQITMGTTYPVDTSPPKTDKYVQQVKEKFEQRSQVGIEKYDTTLERDDLDILDWINHAQEEAMDLTLYLEVIKEKLKK
tara:strand:- start:685 stop:996 length:312 start_codon:yes stop_codon:yes gene_type:complete